MEKVQYFNQDGDLRARKLGSYTTTLMTETGPIPDAVDDLATVLNAAVELVGVDVAGRLDKLELAVKRAIEPARVVPSPFIDAVGNASRAVGMVVMRQDEYDQRTANQLRRFAELEHKLEKAEADRKAQDEIIEKLNKALVDERTVAKALTAQRDTARNEVDGLKAERDKLADFKKNTHILLDEVGVPTFADGGCRVGERIRWLAARVGDGREIERLGLVDSLRKERDREKDEAKRLLDDLHMIAVKLGIIKPPCEPPRGEGARPHIMRVLDRMQTDTKQAIAPVGGRWEVFQLSHGAQRYAVVWTLPTEGKSPQATACMCVDEGSAMAERDRLNAGLPLPSPDAHQALLTRKAITDALGIPEGPTLLPTEWKTRVLERIGQLVANANPSATPFISPTIVSDSPLNVAASVSNQLAAGFQFVTGSIPSSSPPESTPILPTPTVEAFKQAIDVLEGYRQWSFASEVWTAFQILKAVSARYRSLLDLHSAVRSVVTQRADDLCWRDVYTNLAHLVGVEFKPELIPDDKFLENCQAFCASLRTGGPYIPVNVEKNQAVASK